MALDCPFLVFRSNPDLRSIGEPVFNPLSAAHWLSLAEPANNSRKSIFPFITHCHKTWAYDAEPSSTGTGGSGEAPVSDYPCVPGFTVAAYLLELA